MSYINRYKDLLKAQKINFVCTDKVLFREYNKIIIPLGPIAAEEKDFDCFNTNLLKKLKGFLIWWSFKSDKKTDWYGVVKDTYFEISDYKSSNVRNQIKKGLKNNQLKKIDANFLVNHGYTVYHSALLRFSNRNKIINESEYQRSIIAYQDFDDIVDIWGIFQEEQLIGYSIVYKYDKIEANISEVRIVPEKQKMYPSYALFHQLQEYYLKEEGHKYLSDGYRSVSHETNIQDLLIRKFGFVKVYLDLNVYIRKPLRYLIQCLYIFKVIIKINKLQSIFRLIDYAKNNR